jgi:hypothetical protein
VEYLAGKGQISVVSPFGVNHDRRSKMAGPNAPSSSTDDNIALMQKMQEENARLMTTSMTVSTQVQGMATAAHTVNGASAAGGEVAKGTANDMRQAAKAS